jgi:hypothetical protein
MGKKKVRDFPGIVHRVVYIYDGSCGVSTERLYAGLRGMLNQVGSTLLPSSVNTERLVKYTLVYYRARAQLRYWIPLFT